MKNKGKLVRWNNARGFGFIKSESLDKDVFIHISTLKHLARKPLVGDMISFDVVMDEKYGKQRAENAAIDGVEVLAGKKQPQKKSSGLLIGIIVVVVIIAVAGYIFTQ